MKAIKWQGDFPKCDFHRQLEGVEVDGPIDGPTKAKHWANMCEECFAEWGYIDSSITTIKVVDKEAS